MTSGAAAADRTAWLTVAAIVAAGALSAIQVGKVGPALPLIRPDLGLDLVAAGWVASIVNMTGAVIGIPAGILADCVGHRRVVLAGLMLLALGSIAGGLAESGAALLASRFLEGVGYGSIVVAGTPLVVAAASARERGTALGIWSAYFPVGMIVMLFAAALTLDLYGWRNFWLANAVLCAAFLLFFAPATRDLPRGGGSGPGWPSIAQALTAAGPWLLALILMVKSFASFALMTWLPTFLVDELGRSVFEAAALTAVFVAGFITPNIAGGALLRRRGIRAWHLVVAAGLGIALFPQGVFADWLPLPLRFLLLLAYASTAGFVPGLIFARIPAHAPSPAAIGAITGLIIQCANIGNLVGPPALAEIVLAFDGWANVGPVYLILGSLVLLGGLTFRRIEARLPP